MASGAAYFALNTGAAIVPFSLQRGGGVFGHRMKLYEPLDYELNGDRRSDLRSIMTEVTTAGEKIIREAPGQWMSWFGLWQWWDKAAEMVEIPEPVRAAGSRR